MPISAELKNELGELQEQIDNWIQLANKNPKYLIEHQQQNEKYQVLANSIQTALEHSEVEFQIFVKNFDGKTYTIDISPKNSVEEIKSKVEKKIGVSTDVQRLIFEGKQLEDGKNVSDYVLGKRCTLHLTLRIKGGGGDYEELLKRIADHLDVDATDEAVANLIGLDLSTFHKALHSLLETEFKTLDIKKILAHFKKDEYFDIMPVENEDNSGITVAENEDNNDIQIVENKPNIKIWTQEKGFEDKDEVPEDVKLWMKCKYENAYLFIYNADIGEFKYWESIEMLDEEYLSSEDNSVDDEVVDDFPNHQKGQITSISIIKENKSDHQYVIVMVKEGENIKMHYGTNGGLIDCSEDIDNKHGLLMLECNVPDNLSAEGVVFIFRKTKKSIAGEFETGNCGLLANKLVNELMKGDPENTPMEENSEEVL
jgi:hypothetical protein